MFTPALNMYRWLMGLVYIVCKRSVQLYFRSKNSLSIHCPKQNFRTALTYFKGNLIMAKFSELFTTNIQMVKKIIFGRGGAQQPHPLPHSLASSLITAQVSLITI